MGAKKHVREKPVYRDYPETEKVESGCKVGWRYYSDLDEARACAEAAKWNGKIAEMNGYDFGYCVPGEIEYTRDGDYRVCIP